MRKYALTAIIMALALAATTLRPAWAQMVDGQVVRIDESARKITIKHGPVKKFDMEEGMTMVYAVRDPALLKTVKAGDKIKFDADRVNGQFTVMKIEKGK